VTVEASMTPKDELQATRFLNVDLDIRLRRGLDELLPYFEKAMFVLHREAGRALLEVNGAGSRSTLERTILKMIEAIRSLPPEARTLWDRCESRKFDIGVQAGVHPRNANFRISSDTLAALAEVRGEVVFAVYAVDREPA
jgi:hypothetical protein